MAKKKKRRRPIGYRSEDGEASSGSRPVRARTAPSGSSREGVADRRRTETAGRRTTSRRAPTPRASQPASPWGAIFGRRSAGPRRPSLQPPVAATFANGMSVVGRSPLLLVITFLAVLGLWLGFTGYGVIQSAAPQAMVLLISLPPLHTLLDLTFLSGGRTVSAAQVVAASAGLVVVRAILASLLISLILRGFNPGSDEDVRASLRRATRSFIPMVGIELGFLIAATTAITLVSGFLGNLGVIIVLVAGLYFFSYAPVIAVGEQEGTVRAAQLSIRAARVPGPQHVMFTTGYLALTLFVSVVTPGSRVAAATPSLAVWGFALLVGFLHVSVLGAFTYRWLLIREHALPATE
jgi:hypothetical protein